MLDSSNLEPHAAIQIMGKFQMEMVVVMDALKDVQHVLPLLLVLLVILIMDMNFLEHNVVIPTVINILMEMEDVNLVQMLTRDAYSVNLVKELQHVLPVTFRMDLKILEMFVVTSTIVSILMVMEDVTVVVTFLMAALSVL